MIYDISWPVVSSGPQKFPNGSRSFYGPYIPVSDSIARTASVTRRVVAVVERSARVGGRAPYPTARRGRPGGGNPRSPVARFRLLSPPFSQSPVAERCNILSAGNPST